MGCVSAHLPMAWQHHCREEALDRDSMSRRTQHSCMLHVYVHDTG